MYLVHYYSAAVLFLPLVFFYHSILTNFSGLGVWQLKRREWKMNLLASRESNVLEEPVLVETILSGMEDKNLDTKRVRVSGTLLYDKSVLVGPRVSPEQQESNKGSMQPRSDFGYFLLTPVLLRNNQMVMLNRGFIKTNEIPSLPLSNRLLQLPKEESSTFVTLMSKTESIPRFISGIYDKSAHTYITLHLPTLWNHLEINQPKSSIADQYCFDIIEPFQVGLVRKNNLNYFTGGNLAISPDMHLVYASTWFTLAACLSGIIYFRFRVKVKL